MVNEDLIKKKKKKKKRDGDEAGLDDTMKKKKKKQLREDGSLKKKKKRKKSLKNSTMLFDPEEPIPDSQETVQTADSDQELFGSQSPPPSPIKLDGSAKSDESPLKSTPPLVKYSPAKLNGKTELVTPEKLAPVKARERPSPVIKFAKKTKIVNKKWVLLNDFESTGEGLFDLLFLWRNHFCTFE